MNIKSVLMVGTSTCFKCKSLLPLIAENCMKSKIPFLYKNVEELTKEELEVIKESKAQTVPVLIIYEENSTKLITGTSIVETLSNILSTNRKEF